MAIPSVVNAQARLAISVPGPAIRSKRIPPIIPPRAPPIAPLRTRWNDLRENPSAAPIAEPMIISEGPRQAGIGVQQGAEKPAGKAAGSTPEEAKKGLPEPPRPFFGHLTHKSETTADRSANGSCGQSGSNDRPQADGGRRVAQRTEVADRPFEEHPGDERGPTAEYRTVVNEARKRHGRFVPAAPWDCRAEAPLSRPVGAMIPCADRGSKTLSRHVSPRFNAQASARFS